MLCSPPATTPLFPSRTLPPPRPVTTAPRSRACAPARKEPFLCLTLGMWIRPVGCDILPGGIVLAAGETVRPAHLALLAQVGTRLEDAYVRRRPRVGVLSTGNDMAVGTDDTAGARRRGRIPDANRPLLLAQTTRGTWPSPGGCRRSTRLVELELPLPFQTGGTRRL